jgi:FkbM family methyltransferase
MKFEKLRKIYRILFSKQQTQVSVFENNLNSNHTVEKFKLTENKEYLVDLKNKSKVIIRDYTHSDYDVFKQIFNIEEYKIVVSIFQLNPILLDSKENVFIDAGANVGYTTIYFSAYAFFSQTFCIEPSSNNFNTLKKNISLLNDFDKIVLYENALSGKEGFRFEIDNSFRDNRDWSTSFKEVEGGAVLGITVDEIVAKNTIKNITFLKIDIEGAERFVFDKKNDLSFLKITKVVIIEIHDEFNIRDSINSILMEHNFLLFESGESTIGINKTFLL